MQRSLVQSTRRKAFLTLTLRGRLGRFLVVDLFDESPFEPRHIMVSKVHVHANMINVIILLLVVQVLSKHDIEVMILKCPHSSDAYLSYVLDSTCVLNNRLNTHKAHSQNLNFSAAC